MITATIIAAIIAAAGVGITAAASNASMEDAQNEAKGLAMLSREDTLRESRKQNRLKDRELRLYEQKQAQEQKNFDLSYRTGMRQQMASQLGKVLVGNTQYQDHILSLFKS